MADPLSLLREAIVKKLPITLLSGDGKPVQDLPSSTSIKIGDAIFPRNILTAYRFNDKHLPLDQVYFAYLNGGPDVGFGGYMSKALSAGFEALQLHILQDLHAYLSGQQETSHNVDKVGRAVSVGELGKRTLEQAEGDHVSKKLKAEGAAGHGNDDNEAMAAVRSIISRERVLQDRTSVTSANTLKTFVSLQKRAMDILMRKSKPSSSSSSHPSKPKPTDKRSSSSNAPSSSGSRKPTSAPSSSSSVPRNLPPEKRIPIIIVPAALTGLLTLYNVRDLLEKSVFRTPQEVREQGLQKVSPTVIYRPSSHGKDGKPVQYHIIDSVHAMKKDDWERVVCVFTNGKAWEFKGWKWEDPVQIFNRVKGFHLQYDDAQTDATVKSWNVSMLKVNKYKRHLDKQCVLDFWNQMMQFTAKKSYLVT